MRGKVELNSALRCFAEAANRRDPKAAAAHLRRALEIRPDLAPLHHSLGAMLEAAGSDAEAAASYRRSIDINSGAQESYIALARLMLAHGDPRSAIEGFERSLQIGPQGASVHICLAQALAAVDREYDAEIHLRQAIEIDPNRSEAHAMLGYRLQTRGRFEEARASFLRSIELTPNQAVAYYGLSQGLRFTDSDRPLLEQMEVRLTAGSLAPKDRMYLLYSLGKAHADLQDYGAAMTCFDEANRIAFDVCLGGRQFDRNRYLQLVEQTISKYSSEFLAKTRAVLPPPMIPIFIVGMMRSGTTLLDQIVSSHPAVGALGENEYWLKAQPDFPERLRPDYLKLLGGVVPASPYVTDKTPQNFQVLGVIHQAFPNSRILHVRRNPLDNGLSIYTTAYDRSPDFAHDKASIAFAYRTYRRLMEHWRKVLPAHLFLEVDYEDLVANRREVVAKVLSFCGLEWDDACLAHEQNERIVKTPSLWQVRQPVYSSSVGRWKNYEPWLGELLAAGESSDPS